MKMERYTRYPAYKDSGVEWLGEIPAGWEVRRLKFDVDLNPSPSEARNLSPDTEVSFVPMEAVGEYGGLDLSRSKMLSEIGTGYTYFADGDVVVAKITPCFENGKGAIAKGLVNRIAFGTTELHVLRNHNTMDQRFLFYVTMSDAFRKLGEAEMYGAGGQKRVPEDFIKNLKYPIPPKSEQQVIAAFLDRETAKIDSLIVKKKCLIDQLQEKRTALITHTVTTGLDPTAKMMSSGLDWMGDVPRGWKKHKLAHAFKCIGSGTTPPTDEAEWFNGDICWVTTSELRENLILDTEKKITYEAVKRFSALRVYPPKTLLIAMYGATIGRLGILGVEAATNQACCCLADSDMIEIEFLFFWFQAYRDQIVFLASGGGQPNINMEKIRAIRIFAPSIELQKLIVTEIKIKTVKIDDLVHKADRAISELNDYRAALISDAVTGKIHARHHHEVAA